MTTEQQHPAEQFPDPAAGPADELELVRPDLDPWSTATLAVNAELDRQMLAQPDMAIAIDPGPIVNAALMAFGDVPRVPEWIDGEPRRIGGGRVGGEIPDPEILVDLGTDGRVKFDITTTVDLGDGPVDLTSQIEVSAADTIVWAHNVLSAGHRMQRSITPAG